MIFLTDEQLRDAERYADNETARCLVDEVKHLRTQLAAVTAERDEYRALFEVKSLQRSIDEAREHIERSTVEQIAQWLESGPDITSADTMLHVARHIRSGAWKGTR